MKIEQFHYFKQDYENYQTLMHLNRVRISKIN